MSRSHHFQRFVVSLFFCTLALGQSGCSTPQSKALKEIQVGMDKADVLEIAGNPSRITRHLGQDRWSYEDFSASTKNNPGDISAVARTTFVYFSDGRVTYVGPAEINPDKVMQKSPPHKKAKESGFQSVGE